MAVLDFAHGVGFARLFHRVAVIEGWGGVVCVCVCVGVSVCVCGRGGGGALAGGGRGVVGVVRVPALCVEHRTQANLHCPAGVMPTHLYGSMAGPQKHVLVRVCSSSGSWLNLPLPGTGCFISVAVPAEPICP